ncbi:MAG: hypothetical protein HS116_19395 [Planctomycetes bacterium]|nr:hypothetical protein [Planctomycetota bacterium]
MNQEERFNEAARKQQNITERFFWPAAGLAVCSLLALLAFISSTSGRSRAADNALLELQAQVKSLEADNAELKARVELTESERPHARAQVYSVEPTRPAKVELPPAPPQVAFAPAPTPAPAVEYEAPLAFAPLADKGDTPSNLLFGPERKPAAPSINSGGWSTSTVKKPAAPVYREPSTPTPAYHQPSAATNSPAYEPSKPTIAGTSREPSANAPYGMGTYGPRGPPAVNGVGENGSRYGDTSTINGKPKTTYVKGYYRKDGTYVRGHYRSK